MGEANGPVLGVSTWRDYQDYKWPYVHDQYGVLDPNQGKVIPVKSREQALELANNRELHYGPAMHRGVSDWLPIE